jgi:hypothetical protein
VTRGNAKRSVCHFKDHFNPARKHDFQSESFEGFDEHAIQRNIQAQVNEQRLTLLRFREHSLASKEIFFPRVRKENLSARIRGDKIQMTQTFEQ